MSCHVSKSSSAFQISRCRSSFGMSETPKWRVKGMDSSKNSEVGGRMKGLERIRLPSAPMSQTLLVLPNIQISSFPSTPRPNLLQKRNLQSWYDSLNSSMLACVGVHPHLGLNYENREHSCFVHCYSSCIVAECCSINIYCIHARGAHSFNFS